MTLLAALLIAAKASALTCTDSWLSVKPPAPIPVSSIKYGYVYVCTKITKSKPGIVTVEYLKNGKLIGVHKPAYSTIQPRTVRLYMSVGEWTIIVRYPGGTRTHNLRVTPK